MSGYTFAYPQAAYFGVGRVGKDQVEDYTRRKGMSVPISSAGWHRIRNDAIFV